MRKVWIEVRLLVSDKLMYWSLCVRGRHCTATELNLHLAFAEASRKGHP